jgi:hypothetical protein
MPLDERLGQNHFHQGVGGGSGYKRDTVSSSALTRPSSDNMSDRKQSVPMKVAGKEFVSEGLLTMIDLVYPNPVKLTPSFARQKCRCLEKDPAPRSVTLP